jgi:hypothetical protein
MLNLKMGGILTGVDNLNRRGDSNPESKGWAANAWERQYGIVSWKPSIASSIDDTAILEPEVYTDSQEDEVSPKATTGASVDITINVTIDGRSWGITRDEAFKLYLDLKNIFEEKIV